MSRKRDLAEESYNHRDQSECQFTVGVEVSHIRISKSPNWYVLGIPRSFDLVDSWPTETHCSSIEVEVMHATDSAY